MHLLVKRILNKKSSLQLNFPIGWSARNFAAVLLGQKCKHTYVSGQGEAQKPNSRVSIQQW